VDILEIEGIGPKHKEKLSAAGIHTTEELLK
jgi:predicted flap endonuclease-1-like 5' DNA nuclease